MSIEELGKKVDQIDVIFCGSCEKVIWQDASIATLEAKAYQVGWRIVGVETMCPDCVAGTTPKNRIVKVNIDEFKTDLGEKISESDPSESFVHEKMFEKLKNDSDEEYRALSLDGMSEIVETSVGILEDYYYEQQREITKPNAL